MTDPTPSHTVGRAIDNDAVRTARGAQARAHIRWLATPQVQACDHTTRQLLALLVDSCVDAYNLWVMARDVATAWALEHEWAWAAKMVDEAKKLIDEGANNDR